MLLAGRCQLQVNQSQPVLEFPAILFFLRNLFVSKWALFVSQFVLVVLHTFCPTSKIPKRKNYVDDNTPTSTPISRFKLRRPLFYLLDYVTRQSEKLRFGKKIGSETNWWEISKYRHTLFHCKKCYVASLSIS